MRGDRQVLEVGEIAPAFPYSAGTITQSGFNFSVVTLTGIDIP
jgi:hypothetical protein